MAEEHEIEEGEIYDDSHIDVKIQSVLGDFMKDIEGGVSVENLGPKFGVYGSFLPNYRLSSSLLFQPTTLEESQNSKDLKIDHTESVEVSGDEPPVSPFIIEGDWIRCGKCWKWRLLPYGTKPEQLSESWVCSMLDWLPGMNCCDISEEDTTRVLHALYQIDVKAHNGREVSVKKRKLREQLDYYLVTSRSNGNDLGESDANAYERRFRKQKKSKVFRTGKGEEKSRRRGTVEREHQTTEYRVKHQSQAESGMSRKPVCKVPFKKALGYGKVARPCIAIL